MIRALLILITILFTTNIYAHSTKNIAEMDTKQECKKKKSMLNFISNHKLYRNKGGELIKFQSYTGFDMRTVLTGAHKKNPIEITGFLQLPSGTGQVPIVIFTHSSGGPGIYMWSDWVYHSTQNLLKNGIGVLYIDNFCHRGAKDTWRDQSKVPLINGAIDAMMALKVLRTHPRSNGKFGTTGHSRGGTNSLYLADVKFTSQFIEGTEGFDAILPEAAECRAAGLFNEPELTSNTKLLLVHGGADDYTLAKFCVDHVKKIKAQEGQIEIDVKDGWYHEWHMGSKPKKIRGAMTLHECPAYVVNNEGRPNQEMLDLVLKKYKLYQTEDEFYQDAQENPRKQFKKIFKIFKKEKCISKGVTIGGENMDLYMPQFINFFKVNLL